MKFFYICLALFLFNCSEVSGQMIKIPKKDEPSKKKGVRREVKFNDENEDKAKPERVDSTFAYLLIKANKGSDITVNINEKESGKIRQGMSKKIPVNNNDELIIVLNDGQGNLYDTAFVVDDNDAGKNIVVAFPEIDYAAIKAEENREKKEKDDAERARKKQNNEEASVKKEQEEKPKRHNNAYETSILKIWIEVLDTNLIELLLKTQSKVVYKTSFSEVRESLIYLG